MQVCEHKNSFVV